MLHHLALAAAVLAAQGTNSDLDLSVTKSSGTVFTNVSMASPVTTDPLYVNGFRWIQFKFDYTRSSGTAVKMTCQHGATSTGTFYDIESLVWDGTKANSVQSVWEKAVSSNVTWAWTTRIKAQFIKCTFTVTGGGAGDTLTVTSTVGSM